MTFLKHSIFFILIGTILWSCSSLPIKNKTTQKEEPVVIANDSLEYEVIIIDLGFNLFLNSVAHPRGYYSQQYLESRNQFFVTNWNIRAQNPTQYNPNVFQNIIDYQQSIDYGYEVNYLLFNYFMFAQQKYRINLSVGFSGRIR